MLTTRRKFTLNKINANFPKVRFTYIKLTRNFPKVRFTYIKLTRNFRKQCAPNFILREFATIQASQRTYLKKAKKQQGG